VIEVVPYEASAQATWDALVADARGRHFLFERGYMDYHADRFTDASLLVLRDGRAVAAMPANREGDELISHGGLTFGGLLSDASMTVSRTLEAFEAIIAHLRATGVRRWVYKPVPHIYHLVPAEEDLFALSSYGATLVKREVAAAIPAGRAARRSSERRRAIARGRRADLTLGQDDAIEEFLALVGTVLRDRHDAEPVHTPAEMRLLADRFPDGIRLFTARADGELVSGVLIYETPAVARAQYIATSDRGYELRAGDALFDHLLTAVYPDKPWFEFGTSNLQDGSINANLIRNKEGYGARAVVFDRYAVDIR